VKKLVLCVGILCVGIVCAIGAPAALAEELATAPAAFITTGLPYLLWSGVYVGVNGGFGWGDSAENYSANDAAALAGTCGGTGRGTCPTSSDFVRHGAIAGGQIGFNWQISPNWLTGIEADYQWSDMNATTATPPFRLGNAGATMAVANQSVTSFGTLRARMGVVIANPLLLYGTAGLAIGRVSEQATIAGVSTVPVSLGGFSYLCNAGGSSCFSGSSEKTLIGWSGGAGAEYAITSQLTFKAELLYADLGPMKVTTVAQNTVPGTAPASFTAAFPAVNFVIVRGGVNFRF
jgi:outer membrane immunogenic protein